MEDIVVLHAADLKKALPLVARRPLTWLYLGQNIRQRDNISRVLGRENRCFTGGLLQEVACHEKQPFLDFIAELGLLQKNKLYWWASNTAYRNPFLARDFFLLWCYSAVFERVCLEGKDREKQLLVFVEDRWLYRYLWENYQQGKDGFRFLSRKSVFPEMAKAVMKGIAGRVFALAVMAYYALRSRNAASDYKIGSVKERKRVFIYSWVQDRFFEETGQFRDAYFGRLPEILTGDGFDVAYITPPSLPGALRRKCQEYPDYEFIFLDGYLSFSDILRCLFSRFPISYGGKGRFKKILLQRQTVREISAVPVHALYYYAFKRWLRETNADEIAIIYPFENQPWEKMLCMAARESGKNIRLIAYQHSVVPPLLLCYFLGNGESDSMPLPDFIVANGEKTLDLLEGAGYGKVKLINGGALRYEHVPEKGKTLPARDKERRAILVALPYIANLAEEMLSAVLGAFGDLKDDIRVVIKAHPVGPSKRLEVSLPAHFYRTDRPIPQVLEEADLLIYSSSTAGLEAFLAGVPVVKYLSEHIIDLDSLDDDGVTVRSCFESNMREVVLETLKDSSNYITRQPHASFDRFFSPVDEEAWKQVARH